MAESMFDPLLHTHALLSAAESVDCRAVRSPKAPLVERLRFRLRLLCWEQFPPAGITWRRGSYAESTMLLP